MFAQRRPLFDTETPSLIQKTRGCLDAVLSILNSPPELSCGLSLLLDKFQAEETPPTIKGLKFGANTNEQGYYQISQITPGTYDLVVKTQSYNTHREKVEVKAGSIQVISVYMEESVDELGPLTIVGEEDRGCFQVWIVIMCVGCGVKRERLDRFK